MTKVKNLIRNSLAGIAYWKILDFLRLLKPFQKSELGFYFRGPREMIIGEYEKYLIDYLAANPDSCTNLVNIGANVGFFPCVALENGFQYVIAVEPNKVNYKILKSNIARNEWGTVSEIYQAACGSRPGSSLLFGRATGSSLLPGWEGNPKSKGVGVDLLTLEQLVPPNKLAGKTLVIIDVEGFEYEVMLGAHSLLAQASSFVWIIEVSLYRNVDSERKFVSFLEAFFKLFIDSGYKIFVWGESWRELTADELLDYLEGRVIWPALPFLFRK